MKKPQKMFKLKPFDDLKKELRKDKKYAKYSDELETCMRTIKRAVMLFADKTKDL